MKWINNETFTPREVGEFLGVDELRIYHLPVKDEDPMVAVDSLDGGSRRTDVFSPETGEKLEPVKIYVDQEKGGCIYLELKDRDGMSYSYVARNEGDLYRQIQSDNKLAASKHEAVARHFNGWKGFEDISCNNAHDKCVQTGENQRLEGQERMKFGY